MEGEVTKGQLSKDSGTQGDGHLKVAVVYLLHPIFKFGSMRAGCLLHFQLRLYSLIPCQAAFGDVPSSQLFIILSFNNPSSPHQYRKKKKSFFIWLFLIIIEKAQVTQCCYHSELAAKLYLSLSLKAFFVFFYQA